MNAKDMESKKLWLQRYKKSQNSYQNLEIKNSLFKPLKDQSDEMLKEIMNVLDLCLTDPNEMSVILLRYINHYSWKEIAKRMDYSSSTVYRLHRSALEHITLP